MKKILLAFMITALFAGAASAAAQDDAPLTALLENAKVSNPQISAAKERTAAAEAQRAQSSAKLGPKLDVATGALWQRDGLSSNMNAFGGLFNIPVGYRNTYAAAAALTQVIYSGGSLQAKEKAAKLYRDAIGAEEVRTGEGVSNAVRRAYYALRCAQAKELVAREAVALSKNHMSQAEKLFNAGVVAKSDVLRSKVAVASAELDLIRAQNGCDISMTALRRAVGRDLDMDLAEKKKLDAILADDSGFSAAAQSGDVEEAFQTRQELKVYSLLSQQAQKLAKAAQGQTLPQVLGALGYIAADDNFFPTENSEPAAGVLVYWNLYNGGETKAKMDEAKARSREMLSMLDDMKNSIRMEVTQADLNIRSAKSRLEVARRQLASSREDYRIALRRYDENVGTNLDTLDARLALTNSMSEVVTAVYDIKSYEADLIYAMGEK